MGGSIARDPLFWTVSVGLVMVAIGASIEYFKLGGETANQYRGNIWYYTLAIFVPIFALIGRIRRSTVFYSAAIVSAIISLATIVTTAHIFLTVVNTSEPSSSRDRFIVLFAGNILEILGMGLALTPAFTELTLELRSFIASLFAAAFWFAAGVIFCIKTDSLLAKQAFQGTICLAFAACTIFAALKRSSSLLVALTCLELLLMTNPFIAGLSITRTALAVAYPLTVCGLIAQIISSLEFALHPIPDATKPTKIRSQL